MSLPIAAGGTVTLLHVIPTRLPIRLRRQAQKDARRSLAAEALNASTALRADVSLDHTVTVGAPGAVIARCAARVKADLIVMGRGADRPLRDSFLGSTAERVIRQGRRPVLVVRLPARGPYHRPTLGIDLDEAAEAVVTMFARVIPPPRPPGRIIHAYDGPYLGMAYAGLSKDELEEEEDRYGRTATPKLMHIVARSLRPPQRAANDVPGFKTYVRFGDPRAVLKAAVRKLDVDLLLLGTHAYPVIAQAFLGTVAGDILRHVRCDVLVVPPRRARRGAPDASAATA